MVVLDNKELDSLSPQQSQFLTGYLKDPLAEFGECLLILAFLVKGGLIEKPSEVTRKSLKKLKEQLLSLGDRELGKQLLGT
ncbi:hypothetical protein AMJ50_02520 [Parcubacteria bacterium DG_74_3]|nr:MAG: hypothetical protein AMJ50_02520 [Parcubacteria bacterium DG_74_3]